jgi:hypothetical protein
MRRTSRIVVLGMLACVLAISGSALAVAQGHHRHGSVADVNKDVKDANKDSTDASKDKAAAQADVTTPDSAAQAQQEQADAQNEQVDNQSENQDGQQEGDNPAQAKACQGLLTDNVQYDDQTGTCTAEIGQDNGTTGGQDNSSTTGGQDNNQQNG